MESLWYSPHLEIEKAMLGRQRLSERNRGIKKTQTFQQDTKEGKWLRRLRKEKDGEFLESSWRAFWRTHSRLTTDSQQTTNRLPADTQHTPSRLPAYSQYTSSILPADSQQFPSRLPADSQQTLIRLTTNFSKSMVAPVFTYLRC